MIVTVINTLAKVCGYFFDSEVNNGYGCSHEDNEQNRCSADLCPLALPIEENFSIESEKRIEDINPDGNVICVTDEKARVKVLKMKFGGGD